MSQDNFIYGIEVWYRHCVIGLGFRILNIYFMIKLMFGA